MRSESATTADEPRLIESQPSGRRVVSDIVVQIVGRILNAGLGAVVLVLLVRGLGTSDFGVWSTVTTVVGLGASLTDLGFTNIGVTRASAAPDETSQWLGALLLIRVALSLLAAAVSVGAVALLGGGDRVLVTGIVLALATPLGAASAVTAIFQIKIRNDIPIAVLTVNSVLWTAGVAIAALLHFGLVGFALVFTGVNAATILLGIVIALRHVRVSFDGWRTRVAIFVRIGLPISVTALLVLAYGQVDQVLVYSIDGHAAAGLYAGAYRILNQAGIIPLSLTTTLYPVLTRARLIGRLQMIAILQRALESLWAVSLLPLVVVVLCGGGLMGLLFGAAFRATGTSLDLLMGAFVLICLSYLVNCVVLLEGLQRFSSVVSVAALALNVGFNVLLLPRWGFVAAAAATLATELLVFLLNGWRVLTKLQWRPNVGRGLRAAAVAGLTIAVLEPLRLLDTPAWLVLVISSAVYGGLLVLVRGVDVATLRSLVSRRAVA